MEGFNYPMEQHARRHGPVGYATYESYRPWLRDEFYFRCVYCLHREQWNTDDSAFHIDHFSPVAVNPELRIEYANLLYACSRCNLAKSDLVGLPDPCQVAFGECLTIRETGHVETLNDLGIRLSDTLKLNETRRVERRHRWIRTLSCLSRDNPSLYREFMSFPSDLDDLRPLRPLSNSLPDSVKDCFFAQKEKGRLAPSY